MVASKELAPVRYIKERKVFAVRMLVASTTVGAYEVATGEYYTLFGSETVPPACVLLYRIRPKTNDLEVLCKRINEHKNQKTPWKDICRYPSRILNGSHVPELITLTDAKAMLPKKSRSIYRWITAARKAGAKHWAGSAGAIKLSRSLVNRIFDVSRSVPFKVFNSPSHGRGSGKFARPILFPPCPPSPPVSETSSARQ